MFQNYPRFCPRMIPPNTVLLLGAGSSLPYGFPLASGLGKDVLLLAKSSADALLGVGINSAAAQALAADFAESLLPSIDNFLARREDLMGVGKQLIALALLRAEARWKRRNYALPLNLVGDGTSSIPRPGRSRGRKNERGPADLCIH